MHIINESGLHSLIFYFKPYLVCNKIVQTLGHSDSQKEIRDHVDAEDKTDGVTIRDAIL